ncbi:hypothetical protein KHU50_006447 [Colletotrichum sp. SAR 10_65]|nr:hypothetical protein KHU50_006447 [Colletotrichum sp. SAR 10_65]KAI8223436.1 hypothetical protein K4K53_006898 [Colletotrichum sp. SAR 10_77]
MDPPETPDYYADLGVSENSTAQEIKKAHRDLVLQHHPDKQAPGACKDAHEFRKAREAFEVLRDEVKRAEYDAYYPDIRAAWVQYREFLERQAQEEVDRLAAEEARLQWEKSEARRQYYEEWLLQMDLFRAEERQIKRNISSKWELLGAQVKKEDARAQEKELAKAFDAIGRRLDTDKKDTIQLMELQQDEEFKQIMKEFKDRWRRTYDKEEKKFSRRGEEERANAQKDLESRWTKREQRKASLRAQKRAEEQREALNDLHARRKT